MPEQDDNKVKSVEQPSRIYPEIPPDVVPTVKSNIKDAAPFVLASEDDKLRFPPPPMQKLPAYHKTLSRNPRNGVFLLSKKGVWVAHNDNPGPVGWDLKTQPMGGASFGGLIGFLNVWESKNGYITYAEAAPETEAEWLALKYHPVADRTIAGFMSKLLIASQSHSNIKVRELASEIINDTNLDKDFITGMKKHSKGRKLRAADEDFLARVFCNPNRGNMI